MAQIHCFECGRDFCVTDEYAGHRTPCPFCRHEVLVPRLGPTPAAASLPPEPAPAPPTARPLRSRAALDVRAPMRRSARRPREARPRRRPEGSTVRRAVFSRTALTWSAVLVLGLAAGVLMAQLLLADSPSPAPAASPAPAPDQTHRPVAAPPTPAVGADRPPASPPPLAPGQRASRFPVDHGQKTIFDF